MLYCLMSGKVKLFGLPERKGPLCSVPRRVGVGGRGVREKFESKNGDVKFSEYCR